MNAPIKVDITTGDSIVPAEVEYPYPMLFEDRAIRLMSYPVATILAEKLKRSSAEVLPIHVGGTSMTFTYS